MANSQSRSIKLTDGTIRAAVRLWCEDPSQATAEYGHIEDWDTSEVTDMTDLFRCQTDFNDNISRWNTSSATKMNHTFSDATSFNQDLSGWDVSKVTDMDGMFSGATSFNQDLSGWDVSKVTVMGYMFFNATSFNHDLSGWDVSKVTDMCYMFYGATSFNQDLSGWDVSKVTWRMSSMFSGATALIATLEHTSGVSSFFQGVYRDMPRAERLQAFACAFPWPRRRAFMLFLVHHGYLYSASAPSNYKGPGATKPSNEVAPCDAIFDVEDIYRYICMFL